MSAPEALPRSNTAPRAPFDPESVRAWFEPRAAEVDAGHAGVREGIQVLLREGLSEGGVATAAGLITAVARSDMASAFSAWAHRMVLEYLALAPAGSRPASFLPAARAGSTIGATAMAAGTARYLTGAPLPVTWRADGNTLVLDGTIPWASNLLPPFVGVTAAAASDDPDRVLVVVFTDETPGVTIAPYPDLLALTATGSSSIRLAGARIPVDAVVSDDLPRFVERILPPFLLLQSAFCRGLAGRALDEAGANLGRMAEILRPDHDRLRGDANRAGQMLDRMARRVDRIRSRRGAPADGPAIPLRDLLRLRLRLAHLADQAVRLELATMGGRGYLRLGGTARRLREAAFLPIQAPTEVQLRWTLSRSA